eukprot:1397456-Amphidinium_carterae.1
MPWVLHAHADAGYTSVAQPLDRAYMRPMKCAVKRAAGKSCAEDCLANPGDFSIAVVLAANRPKLHIWFHDAMEFVMQQD